MQPWASARKALLSIEIIDGSWCPGAESNHRHADLLISNGAQGRNRTTDTRIFSFQCGHAKIFHVQPKPLELVHFCAAEIGRTSVLFWNKPWQSGRNYTGTTPRHGLYSKSSLCVSTVPARVGGNCFAPTPDI